MTLACTSDGRRRANWRTIERLERENERLRGEVKALREWQQGTLNMWGRLTDIIERLSGKPFHEAAAAALAEKRGEGGE